MKKHIKKRFLNELEVPSEIAAKFAGENEHISQDDLKKIKVPEGHTPFLMTATSAFQAFPFHYQGQVRLIPEPDPVLVYFHMAYANYIVIEEKKKNILKPLLNPVMGESMINEWYQYFGITSGCIIFLFTTLEAFINRCIPLKFEYRRSGNKSTEIFNKQQIEEFLPFNEKMKIALPQILKKDFFKAHPLTAQHISNLKEFRDSIIHTKTSSEAPTYDHLFKKSLNFKYKEALNAVAAFCNFYHPTGNYIIECDCKLDW